jgi:hypothetical protein
MKNFVKLPAAAALSTAAVVLTSTAASAAIACNAEGECWHVHRNYVYHPEFGVVIHPDGWKWGPGEKFVWREHVGRGYWKNGVWVRF